MDRVWWERNIWAVIHTFQMWPTPSWAMATEHSQACPACHSLMPPSPRHAPPQQCNRNLDIERANPGHGIRNFRADLRGYYGGCQLAIRRVATGHLCLLRPTGRDRLHVQSSAVESRYGRYFRPGDHHDQHNHIHAGSFRAAFATAHELGLPAEAAFAWACWDFPLRCSALDDQRRDGRRKRLPLARGAGVPRRVW